MQDETHYLNLPAFYQKKRDIFYEGIQRSKFKIKPCKGTYFQLLDYSEVSSMKDTDFSEYMTKEVGIAVIPMSPFYSEETGEKLIRICFAKRDEVIKKAANKLANL
jgi:methionine aminotransferase